MEEYSKPTGESYEGRQIDMSIIDRIKRMRNESREPSESLDRMREDTIQNMHRNS